MKRSILFSAGGIQPMAKSLETRSAIQSEINITGDKNFKLD
jgi:hypothetical protein